MHIINLKAAFRNLAKNKVYTFINLGGLAVSLAACIMLSLWVKDELSFDAFHPHTNEIFLASSQVNANGKENTFPSTPGLLATMSRKELPEIENFCRISNNNTISQFEYAGKKFPEDKCAFADPSLFTMFNFPMVKGDPVHPFPDDHSVIISESIAKKYFGNDQALGKTVRADNSETYAVSGVMKDMPANSSIRYDFVFPMSILKEDANDWGNYAFRSYLQLRANADPAAVRKKLTGVLHGNADNDFSRSVNILLQPLSKIHLYKATGEETGMQTVRIFFIVACVIMVIACINYVNLVTARATKRAKEISVRKVIGAGRWQLFGQLIGESALMFIMAMVLAGCLIYLLMPLYNDLSGKQLVINLFGSEVISIFVIAFGATLVAAGIYPAILLSSFEPITALKGHYGKLARGISLRKVLVVVQFTFSIVLISGTFIIGTQLNYLRQKNPGYDRENTLMVAMRPEVSDHYETIKQQLSKYPFIQGVTASSEPVMDVGRGTADIEWEGKRPEQKSFLIQKMSMDRGLMKLLNLQLAAGAGFMNTPADSFRYYLNETAVAMMGITNPVGKPLTFRHRAGVIAGVVKDFHFTDMHNKIHPCILYFDPTDLHTLYVKATGKNASAVIAAVESSAKEYSAGNPLKYMFMDEKFDAMYKSDMRTGKLFNCFAVIAICISCLGLLGLVTFTAETKVKEIGIRKTLGAGIGTIVSMLSKDFVRLVIIASLIACPVAWWLMSKWLESFAYRTVLHWWMFIAASGAAIVIALATISYQSLKAAMASPVKSLRTE